MAIEQQVGYIFDRMDITDKQKINSRKLNYQIKTGIIYFFKKDEITFNGKYFGILIFFRQVHLTNVHDPCLEWVADGTGFYDSKGNFYQNKICTVHVHNLYNIKRNESGFLFKLGYVIDRYKPFDNFYFDIFCDIGAKYISTRTNGMIDGIPNPNYNPDIDTGGPGTDINLFAFDETYNGFSPAMYLGIKISYYLN